MTGEKGMVTQINKNIDLIFTDAEAARDRIGYHTQEVLRMKLNPILRLQLQDYHVVITL